MTSMGRDMKRKKDNEQINFNSFSEYAAYYDILYQDKDYDGESLFISQLIHKFMLGEKKDIAVLDLACGTGRHAVKLSQLGYRVEGSDISKHMVEIAERESKINKFNISYYNESFQTAGNIGKKYDVIISMFSAINYLISHHDLSTALKNIHSLLNDGGIFIFDFWNGNAVLDDFMPTRVKRNSKDGMEVLRISETSIDRISQTANVQFNFMLLKNECLYKNFSENHLIRYYFLQEMSDRLDMADLKVIFRCPFMALDRNVSASDWNVTYVARKVMKERF